MYEIQDTRPGLLFAVGTQTEVYISRLNPTKEDPEYVGNVLRRTCVSLGEDACKGACALRDFEPARYDVNKDKTCADANLRDALKGQGLELSEVLMVAVTGDKVGFADQLSTYEAEGEVRQNPEGWREIPGYNAFFGRPDETAAIGSRLADCAHLGFEFTDSDGNTVYGFEHGTRPNMTGAAEYKFEVDGRPVSYTEYVLSQAIGHYGADPGRFKIRLSSSIRAENFVKHFASAEQREKHIPGWFADGFAWNQSKPGWQAGDPYDTIDVWLADSHGLILRDIGEAMQHLGIPESALDTANMLDPADTNGEFSSYENRAKFGDYRDLYLVRQSK